MKIIDLNGINIPYDYILDCFEQLSSMTRGKSYDKEQHEEFNNKIESKKLDYTNNNFENSFVKKIELAEIIVGQDAFLNSLKTDFTE